MKALILFLVILGSQADTVCDATEFKGHYTCVPCEQSPCATCNGSNKCASCPDGFDKKDFCDQCTETTKMPLKKECVSCTELGGIGKDGTTCSPPAGGSVNDADFCPKAKGVYKDNNVCNACYLKSFECAVCELKDGIVDCESCPAGTKKIELPVEDINFCLLNEYITDHANDFGSGLVPAFGLLIALLTLL